MTEAAGYDIITGRSDINVLIIYFGGKIMKFIFATLHVKNLEESIQFYENIVGMKLARRQSLLYMENVRHWGFPWKIWTRRWGT